MFDLESHVRSWRAQTAEALGDGGSNVLDELESHLREEFDRLIAAGKLPEHAWGAARLALGEPRALAAEFTKLRRPRPWAPAWLAMGFLTLLIAILICFFVARVMKGSGKFGPLLAAHVVFVVAGYVAVFTVGFMGLCGILERALAGWTARQEAAFRSAGVRIAAVALVATLFGIILGAWWARDHLGRWWAWDPREIGGLCVFVWSGLLLQGFRSRHATAQSKLSLSIIGNMVVAVAWFGPALSDSKHVYGFPNGPVGMLLGLFLVSQMALVYLVLLPEGALRGKRMKPAAQP